MKKCEFCWFLLHFYSGRSVLPLPMNYYNYLRCLTLRVEAYNCSETPRNNHQYTGCVTAQKTI